MAIHAANDSLYLIDLDQPLDGFRKYICAWVYRRKGLALVVDPGPASTIAPLVDHLRQLGVSRLDAVLLTHIHLDHAGGVGSLLNAFPVDRVICHPQGIPHLVDPHRLWQGSKDVLGSLAEVYGGLVPADAGRLGFAERVDIGDTAVDVIGTPGHAVHHLAFRIGHVLFVGEMAGVYVPLEGGFHVRPSTPPPFRYGTYCDSIARASALDTSLVCLGHYGWRQDVAGLFERAGRQLDFWADTVARHVRAGSDPLDEIVLADLIAHDPDMSGWHALPEDIRARERIFCFNSIRGIRMYLERNRS